MLFKIFMFIGEDEETNMMNEWSNEWTWWTLLEAKNMDECGSEVRGWYPIGDSLTTIGTYLPTYTPLYTTYDQKSIESVTNGYSISWPL
jgi:hypothetical protein